MTCLYTVEERVIELRVWLSPLHPLAPPRIAAADELGPGANTHWVALYLAYQVSWSACARPAAVRRR